MRLIHPPSKEDHCFFFNFNSTVLNAYLNRPNLVFIFFTSVMTYTCLYSFVHFEYDTPTVVMFCLYYICWSALWLCIHISIKLCKESRHQFRCFSCELRNSIGQNVLLNWIHLSRKQMMKQKWRNDENRWRNKIWNHFLLTEKTNFFCC